jgi:hypothetical protein
VKEWTRYEHDPRENPEAMKDIVENADAVYGFSPNPESTRLGVYAEYDWTDPEFVAEAQEERRAYHESMSTMMDILYEMRAKGASIEEMARAVSTERNRLRLEAYKDDPEGLEKLKQSNLDTYGTRMALLRMNCMRNTAAGHLSFRRLSALTWEWMLAAACMTSIISCISSLAMSMNNLENT